MQARDEALAEATEDLARDELIFAEKVRGAPRFLPLGVPGWRITVVSGLGLYACELCVAG